MEERCPDCGEVISYEGDCSCSEIHDYDAKPRFRIKIPGACFVNAHLVTRNYGGPEEGGWYYDAGSLLESVLVARELADEAIEELRLEYGHLDDGRQLSSVLSTGKVNYTITDQPGESWPKERPHYE